RFVSTEGTVGAELPLVDPGTILVDRRAAPSRTPTTQPGSTRMPPARRATRCAWRTGRIPGVRRRRGS
ncbi:MAG TPA: hypothetical protein VF302_08600, partial [Candidatus Limnocylindrales bacterium]